MYIQKWLVSEYQNRIFNYLKCYKIKTFVKRDRLCTYTKNGSWFTAKCLCVLLRLFPDFCLKNRLSHRRHLNIFVTKVANCKIVNCWYPKKFFSLCLKLFNTYYNSLLVFFRKKYILYQSYINFFGGRSYPTSCPPSPFGWCL